MCTRRVGHDAAHVCGDCRRFPDVFDAPDAIDLFQIQRLRTPQPRQLRSLLLELTQSVVDRVFLGPWVRHHTKVSGREG